MFGVTPVYSFGVLIRNIYVQPITAIERLNLAGDDRVMRILLGRLSSTKFLVNNLLEILEIFTYNRSLQLKDLTWQGMIEL